MKSFAPFLKIVLAGSALLLTAVFKRYQKLFSFIDDFVLIAKSRKSKLSITPQTILNRQLTELMWNRLSFCDNDYGFPVLHVELQNIGKNVIAVERAKFNISTVGRLQNRVEGHQWLSISPWPYNVQFDPLFEGKSIIVELATPIQTHEYFRYSFTIGHETSDVETPTLYLCHLIFEGANNKRIISQPLIIAIPSPVKAKSYSMLNERANVIAENAAIIKTFSTFKGHRNTLAQKILSSYRCYKSLDTQLYD